MDLPIDDNDLAQIVEALPPGDLRDKLALIEWVRRENPDGPWKATLRERYGIVA